MSSEFNNLVGEFGDFLDWRRANKSARPKAPVAPRRPAGPTADQVLAKALALAAARPKPPPPETREVIAARIRSNAGEIMEKALSDMRSGAITPHEACLMETRVNHVLAQIP